MKIRSDATVIIKQTCAECDGQPVKGVISQCSNCGHRYTAEEWAQESAAWNHTDGGMERQLCGCEWRYRYDHDDLCAECEGEGTQIISVTVADLAEALAPLLTGKLARIARMTPGRLF